MSQNTSHAVMSQRHEAHDSLDDFPTPPWAARALCKYVIPDSRTMTAWEPACNRGYLSKGLRPYFSHVFESDIHDYGRDHRIRDFLFAGIYPVTDWIITNPPFRLGEQFALTALDRATKGVALLVRTQFLEGIGRHKNLFTVKPPYMVAQFVERVPMVKGRVNPLASTATSYCWIVWLKHTGSPTLFTWIPPCRKHLELAGDYA